MSPESSQSQPFQNKITPMLSVRGGKKALDFYKRAFGARELFCIESDTGEVVAQLAVGSAEFWIADESPEHFNFSPQSIGGSSARMMLIVESPDASFAQAVAAGGKPVCPIGDQHGWRVGRMEDPFGHHWEICRPLK